MALFDPAYLRNPELVHQAQLDVQTLYFHNTPLYSKDRIEVMMARLASFQADQQREFITLPDIRGHEHDMHLRHHLVFAGSEPNTWVKGQAEVVFRSIQELLDDTRPGGIDALFVHMPINVGFGDCKPCHADGTLVVFRSLPVHVIESRLATHRHAWEESAEHDQLKRIITAQPSMKKVNKIVAFACGALQESPDYFDDEHLRQHAMVFSLREVITEMRRGEAPEPSSETSDAAANGEQEEVEVILQEPAYTPEDRVVLERFGAIVVESPIAFLAVDEETLVVSISPNIPVKQVVADITRPAGMLYYNDKEEWAHYPDGRPPTLCTDPWSPRVEKMMEQYAAIELPYPRNARDIVLWARQLAVVPNGVNGTSGEHA